MAENRLYGELVLDRGPEADAAPAFQAGGFVLCPLPLWSGPVAMGHLMQEVYRVAYAQAREVTRTTRYDLGMLAGIN